MGMFGGSKPEIVKEVVQDLRPWYEQLESFLSGYSKPMEETASAFCKAPRQSAESLLAACANFVYQYPHATAAIIVSSITLGFAARKAYKDSWWSKAKDCVKSLKPGVSLDANFFGFSFGAYARPGVNPAGGAEALGSLLLSSFSAENQPLLARDDGRRPK